MEDKRTALAMLLIIVFVMMYSEYVLAPYSKPPPHTTQPSQSDSGGSVSTTTNGAPPSSTESTSITSGVTSGVTPLELAPVAQVPPPRIIQLEAGEKTHIKTQKFEATIAHLGARFLNFKLLQYRDQITEPALLDLVTLSDDTPAPLGVYVDNQSDAHVQYTLESSSVTPDERTNGFELIDGQELTLVFSGQFREGVTIKKILAFRGNSYFFNVDVRLDSPAIIGAPVWVEWSRYISEEAQHNSIDPFTISVLSDSGKVTHHLLGEIAASISEPFGSEWTGIADKYFASTLIPQIPGMNSRMGRLSNVFFVRVRGSETGGTIGVYAGPKEFKTLEATGFQLERSIDLGFFSFLAYPLLLLLHFFYYLFGNYGLAIVLLTLTVKAAFFPLTRASLRSMKAMQEVAPEMQALRERVKDPTQLNQEMLALYKKRGVNPMGGCLPMLVQIPVFFGLYSALQHSIELRHAPFALWVHDLSAPEHLEFGGIRIPLMIILMGIVMFVQQYFTPTPGMDPTQRKMMLGMSLAFTMGFIIFPFPAGLALYMLVNTLISLTQQAVLKSDKHANPFRVNVLASVAIFSVSYILTLLS